MLFSSRAVIIITIITVCLLHSLHVYPQQGDITITINLRGVHSSDISLLALTPAQTFKPIIEVKGVMNGDSAKLVLLKQYLPGEFVMRFDYRETSGSTPYPAEKYFFAYEQDLEIWVSPMYCNNPDSTYFQENERENSTFGSFSEKNQQEKEKLGLLQNFLMNYDDTDSDFYREGIKEYEKRRKDYNNWLANRALQDKEYFVSNLYAFHYIPQIPWEGSETDRLNSLIKHYFDGTDFKDSLMIRTSDMNQWMDNYVNLYGQQVTSKSIRDSLFSLAGTTAIEKAKSGHPRVYGWMVDYFYRGYETNGIDAGIKILEPYLNDPSCLTSKRQEIERRLTGIRTLVPGSKAPGITMTDPLGGRFSLYDYGTPCEFILVYFWSADCQHCEETIADLYPWQQQADIQEKMMVLAISLDETETELSAWKKKMPQLSGWKHLQAPDGVRSQVASDYYILATPVMILLDSETKEIVGMPGSMAELKEIVVGY